jgi:alpha-galactosidase
MCLSGEITELSDEQWQLVLRAQRLYRKAAPVIKHGKSRRFGELGESWRHPKGWQAMVRTSADEQHALVVIHTFENAPARIEAPLPSGKWKVREHFPDGHVTLAGDGLRWDDAPDFSGRVLLLSR